MPINTEDIIELLKSLSKEERLRVTFRESVKGGFIVGGAATLGAILLGPVGLAIGGVIGGCATAFASRNKFSSVVSVLANMEPKEKEMLAQNIRRIIENLDATDIVTFTALVSGNPIVRKQVMTELANYLAMEMNMAVQF